MGNVSGYFKKIKEENEDFYLEFTDKELARYQNYKIRLLTGVILGVLFFWTGIGIILIIITPIYYIGKKRQLRAVVYRRYLKKKKSKKREK